MVNSLINFAVKTIASIFHVHIDTAKTKTAGAGLTSIATGIGLIGDLLQKADANVMDYVPGLGFVLAGIGTIFARDALKKLGDKLDGQTALKTKVTQASPVLSAATEALKNVPVTDSTQEIKINEGD
jgi:hypothetical protein